jgi:hypothetical protein
MAVDHRAVLSGLRRELAVKVRHVQRGDDGGLDWRERKDQAAPILRERRMGYVRRRRYRVA